MWQPVLMINGFILSILGLSMMFPATLDIYDYNVNWSPFITSMLITLFIGLSLFLSNKVKISQITLRQGYLVTATCWISVSVFAAIPFIISGAIPDIASAIFESVSGVTGTGATILTDIEEQPRSILFWRSMLNGLGGIGIVIFAVAMLPFLGVGGMQMFARENANANDKLMPKFVDMAKWIMLIYIALVISCAVLLYFSGMGRFDAINHAISAVATAGFSTKNNSIAYFNSNLIEFILALFMLLGALPMTFYIMVLKNKELDPFHTGQIKYFFKTIFTLSFFVAVWLSFQSNMNFFTALRYSAFNIISVITTTGMGSTDFLDLGIWTAVFFTILSMHGGCNGSTTGSIKVMRWQVLKSYFHKMIVTSIEPNRVVPIKVGEVSVNENVINSVFLYVFLFFVSIGLTAVILNFMGYDFTTSVSAAIASVTNTGPGITTSIGVMGNYAFFSTSAKYVLCAAMILGRLEIITVLVVFTKAFWKK